MSDGPESEAEIEALSREPGLAELLRRQREVLRLAALRERHQRRHAVANPYPPFPTEPDAA